MMNFPFSLFRNLAEEETNISADEDFPESPLESILNSSSVTIFLEDWRKEMRKKFPLILILGQRLKTRASTSDIRSFNQNR